MGKPGFVPHPRVRANREDSERPEGEPTPIFDAMVEQRARAHHDVVVSLGIEHLIRGFKRYFSDQS